MVTGIVVAATLFLVVLLGVLVYQWVTLGVLQKRLDAAKAEEAALIQREEDLEEDLEDLGDPFWKYDLALKYGIIE